MNVIPIGTSILNWSVFIRELTSSLGDSPTRSIDSSGMAFSDYAKVIIALTDIIENEDTRPLDDLSRANAVLNHLFFSFIIIAPLSVVIEFNTHSQLKILSSKTKRKGYRLLYVSGTLSEWKQSVCSILSYHVSSELKQIAKTCLEFFYKAGLKYVFAETRLANNTLLIESK